MKQITLLLLMFTLSFGAEAQKSCESLRGRWYFSLMTGAKQAAYIVFDGCEWSEQGNPLGNRSGTVVPTGKKLQIEGLTDPDAGPVYWVSRPGYSYLTWKSTWTGEPMYLIFTRERHPGRWYDLMEEKLRAASERR